MSDEEHTEMTDLRIKCKALQEEIEKLSSENSFLRNALTNLAFNATPPKSDVNEGHHF